MLSYCSTREQPSAETAGLLRAGTVAKLDIVLMSTTVERDGSICVVDMDAIAVPMCTRFKYRGVAMLCRQYNPP
jgi:hypothetical protein